MVKSGNWCGNNCKMFAFALTGWLAFPIGSLLALFTDWQTGNDWTLNLINDLASPDMNIDTVVLATPWQYGVTDEAIGGDGEAWSIADLN